MLAHQHCPARREDICGSPDAAAWLWSDPKAAGVGGTKAMQASYDASLPVVQATTIYVEVKLIGGRNVAVRRGDVVLRAAGASWGATRAKVVAQARKFVGLSYLWAGTSGFGFDCSGFTYSMYLAYGVTLPRDADHALLGLAAQRTITENTTLKARVRQLTSDNRTLEERLEAARSNARFADRRIAQLEAQLTEHAPAR